MEHPASWILNLQAEQRPQVATIPEIAFPGMEAHVRKASSSRIGDALYCVKAFVIHASIVPSTQSLMAVVKAARQSRHWIIPGRHERQHGHLVWSVIPDLRSALHVRSRASHPKINGGNRNANRWTLALDIVLAPSDADGPEPFSEWQVLSAAAVVRHCWARFPNLTQVVAHAALDPERASDPGPLFPWQDFATAVVSSTRPGPIEEVAGDTVSMSEIAANPITLACCMQSGSQVQQT